MALSHDPLGLLEGTAGIEFVHLFDDPMYVALPNAHPLANAERVGLASFADEPWMLGTTTSCPDSRLFMRACMEAGFEPTIAFQNDDYAAVLGFVAAGVGVALIPDMAARGVREDVVIRRLHPATPPRPIMVGVPTGYRSPAADAMVAVLHEVSPSGSPRVPIGSPARRLGRYARRSPAHRPNPIGALRFT